MSNSEAAVLILRNIAMFEEASALLQEQITPAIGKAIDDVVKNWAKAHGWDGEYDWIENGTYFGPSDWKFGEDDSKDWSVWYEFAADEAGKDVWDLPRLFGAGQDKNAFFLRVDPQSFGAKRAKWKAFVPSISNSYIEIEKAGFHYDAKKGEWFLPWRLSADSLADAFATDAEGGSGIADALGPLHEALAAIDHAHPFFARLVEEGKRYFKAAEISP